MSAVPSATSPQLPTSYDRVVAELFGRLNYERAPDAARTIQDFRIDRMERFLEALGNPQLTVPCVHLAGSKGKGSTATMVARIAEAAGYRVGLFTSPHLNHLEERFTVNRQLPTRADVLALWERVRPAIEHMDLTSPPGPTFFEIVTALGWLHFQQQQVDLAVMEVGLGGRLDSTNVCAPLVTAITSISRDHMRLLGNTLESIAREKSGIAKDRVPMITGAISDGPAAVIAEVAAAHAAPLLRLGREFVIESVPQSPPPFATPPLWKLNYHCDSFQLADVELAMPGEHQTQNAAVAITIARELDRRGLSLDEAAIRQGLKSARCPLRVDVRGTQPLLVVDVAHNPASISALCRTLQDVTAGRRIAVFGASRDKEVSVLMSLLNEHFDEFVLTQYLNNPRATELPQLEEFAREAGLKRWTCAENPATALRIARSIASPDDLICVTGSFFLATEVGELLAAGEGRAT